MAPAIAQGMTREQLLVQMPAGRSQTRWIRRCGSLSAARAEPVASQRRDGPGAIRMAQTVSIGTPEAMAAARELSSRALRLKIKLDDHYISERLVAIRAAVPCATLIVDANESRRRKAGGAPPTAGRSGVAMLEQPLPAGDDAALELYSIRCRSGDESRHNPRRFTRLAQRYQMVNIKRTKPAV